MHSYPRNYHWEGAELIFEDLQLEQIFVPVQFNMQLLVSIHIPRYKNQFQGLNTDGRSLITADSSKLPRSLHGFVGT